MSRKANRGTWSSQEPTWAHEAHLQSHAPFVVRMMHICLVSTFWLRSPGLQTPKKQDLKSAPSVHFHKADTVVPELVKDNAGVSPAGLAEAPSIKGTCNSLFHRQYVHRAYILQGACTQLIFNLSQQYNTCLL